MGRHPTGAVNSRIAQQIMEFAQLPRTKRLHLKSGPNAGVYRVPGLRNQRIHGRRPTAAQQTQTRQDFSARNGPRDQFLDRVRREASHTDLRALGLTDQQVVKFRNTGDLPRGFEVHHRQPIAAGGTNALDNLTLIRNTADHKLITAAQSDALRGIPPGGLFDVELPMTPPGLTWPTSGMGAYR